MIGQVPGKLLLSTLTSLTPALHGVLEGSGLAVVPGMFDDRTINLNANLYNQIINDHGLSCPVYFLNCGFISHSLLYRMYFIRQGPKDNSSISSL
jgi:hypothetical protein